MSNVNVTVKPDKMVERDETFDITLKVPPIVSKGIRLTGGNRSKAVVTINDSTGKYISM